MSSRRIKIELSSESIKHAIEEVHLIKEEVLFKTSIFVQRLAEIGLRVIEENKYSHGDSDFNDLHAHMVIHNEGSRARATLALIGKDVLFIEFGAGVHYNGSVGTSPSPFGEEFGYTIGSYGLGKGANDSWIYFDDETQKFRISHGTEAALPMTRADLAIVTSVLDIAHEVFGNA